MATASVGIGVRLKSTVISKFTQPHGTTLVKTFAVKTLTALVGSFVSAASASNHIHAIDFRNDFHLVVCLWCIAARLRFGLVLIDVFGLLTD